MNISIGYPPNFEKIKKVFPIKKNTIYTYGDTIYTPGFKYRLPFDLIEHEKVHMWQQGDDPEKWWDRYLVDPEFRYFQELEAYRNQYRVFKKKYLDPEYRNRFLIVLARELSSSLYGGITEFFIAMNQISK